MPPAWVLLVALVASTALHAGDRELVQRRAEMEDVQRRIGELETALGAAEASRSKAARELAEAERAVSEANRQLRATAAERDDTEQALAGEESARREVESRIATRQEELAGWLRRHYIHGGSDVAPLLSARDPNQLARDMHYLEHVGRARLELIESLRADLDELARRIAAIEDRRGRLAAIEAEQRTQQTRLQQRQHAREKALAEVTQQIGSHASQIEALRRDEQRLGQVLEVLTLQAARRDMERAARAMRSEPAPVAVAPAVATPASRAPARRSPGAGSEQGDDRRSEGRPPSQPTPLGVSFAQLRGKMVFPVRGELIGRFGAPRADGGTRWRGVFIRARGGEEVVAVAPGEVVFSDWLRGYGNLIIVDHGDDYLTIYGNNDALFRVVGERIGGGVAIASVGASGGGLESGLYFEIRHKGEPVDPMLWIRGK